jgi:hypothetical protein
MSQKKRRVLIEEDELKTLREYKELPGVPIEDSVKEALEDFIECSLSVRMETLAEHSAHRVRKSLEEEELLVR